MDNSRAGLALCTCEFPHQLGVENVEEKKIMPVQKAELEVATEASIPPALHSVNAAPWTALKPTGLQRRFVGKLWDVAEEAFTCSCCTGVWPHCISWRPKSGTCMGGLPCTSAREQMTVLWPLLTPSTPCRSSLSEQKRGTCLCRNLAGQVFRGRCSQRLTLRASSCLCPRV